MKCTAPKTFRYVPRWCVKNEFLESSAPSFPHFLFHYSMDGSFQHSFLSLWLYLHMLLFVRSLFPLACCISGFPWLSTRNKSCTCISQFMRVVGQCFLVHFKRHFLGWHAVNWLSLVRQILLGFVSRVCRFIEILIMSLLGTRISFYPRKCLPSNVFAAVAWCYALGNGIFQWTLCQ
jgi:hypothetical protein